MLGKCGAPSFGRDEFKLVEAFYGGGGWHGSFPNASFEIAGFGRLFCGFLPKDLV
jgi:hypothetical protein